MIFAALGFLLLSITTVFAASYSRTAHIVGPGFYDAFTFIPGPDVNNGRVQYVDQGTAIRESVASASANSFTLRVDSRGVSRGPRMSANIRTKKQYTTHVTVVDITHMPAGCGTWPALWLADPNIWPAGGEIDILEGVNDMPRNKVTFHALPPCVMPPNLPHTGTSELRDCNVLAEGNIGCGVYLNEKANFGPSFNQNRGGWYALERTDEYYRIWFWPRDSANVPTGVRDGASMIDTSTWGRPSAFFPSTDSCRLKEKLAPHNIIFTLSLCGNWAGKPEIWESCAAGRASNCYDWVDNNPGALKEAYFEINSLDVYEK